MRHTKKAHRRGHRHRAVVLIMVLGILATMTIVATAFLLFMRQSYRAATNTQFAARAELACRSGLEHAIRAIQAAVDTYYVSPEGALDSKGALFDNPDDPYDPADSGGPKVGPYAGWYKYFEGNEEIVKYSATDDSHVIRGRRFQVGTTTVQMEYAIRVYDLDGRLHANLPLWVDSTQVTGAGDLETMIADLGTQAGLDATEAAELGSQSSGPRYSSLSEMARRAGVADLTYKYALERSFSMYPTVAHRTRDSGDTDITFTSGGLLPGEFIGGTALFQATSTAYPILTNTEDTITINGTRVPADGDSITLVPRRPAVNVNTAPYDLLKRLTDKIPGLASIGNLPVYIVANRPYAGRHDFEHAIRLATGDDHVRWIDEESATPSVTLTELQFNNLQNSTAGALGSDGGAFDEDDSTYDEPGYPGVYTFDGWKDASEATWEGPSQTGGRFTNPATGTVESGPSADPTHNVTWSTEFKFTSRFFHIYVLGRGINPDSGRPRGVRRLHAIYDAEADRILWLRWNISRRGSVVDIQ